VSSDKCQLFPTLAGSMASSSHPLHATSIPRQKPVGIRPGVVVDILSTIGGRIDTPRTSLVWFGWH